MSDHDVSSSSQLLPATLPRMNQSDQGASNAQASQSQVPALPSENYYFDSSIWDPSVTAGQVLEDSSARSISPGLSLTGHQQPITSTCPLFEPSNNLVLSESGDLDSLSRLGWIALDGNFVTGIATSQLGQITSIADSDDQASRDLEYSREGLRHINASYSEASLQPFAISKQQSSATMPRTQRLQNTDRTPRLPDPYRNHLRIDRINLYAACMANSNQLGVPNILAKSKGFMSPFCQSHPTQVSQPQSAFSFSDDSFQHIKPNLRPVPAQVSQPHEYYVDLLPFPTFRTRLLAILSLSPPVINEDELKADLDADGIVCWGSTSGGGHRWGCGVPWDMRSWEAKPWFLAK